MAPKPFRWDVSKREQLGQLVSAADSVEALDDAFMKVMQQTSARILAFGDDSDYAFIGRTPESFFDYLSGVFYGLADVPRLHLVQFSLRWVGGKGLDSIPMNLRNGFFDYLHTEGMDPASIASSQRPLALVDFVVEGGTMKNLVGLLRQFSERDGVDWNAVQRRLRIIGLCVKTKNNPNTWRWQQQQDWLGSIPDAVIKNVSVPRDLLYYIGNYQDKLTDAHEPKYWDRYDTRKKPPTDKLKEALTFAVRLFDLGRTGSERRRLAGLIAETHQVRQPATRSLLGKLKASGTMSR